MALTLDATVGGATSNSYVTQARATALLEATPFSTAWAAVTAKDECIVHATTMLDVTFDWVGNRTDLVTPQALEWPRVNAYVDDRGPVIPNAAIPIEVERATAHLAYFYSQQTAQPEDSAGVESVEVPPGVKLKFKPTQVPDTPATPSYIRDMVRKLIVSGAGSKSRGGSFMLERA